MYEEYFFILDAYSLYNPRKDTKQVFVVNVGYEDVKISKGHILIYLTSAKYDSLSKTGANKNERSIINISATTSETDVQILLAISASNKMIFSSDHTLSGNNTPNTKISANTQTKLNYLLNT